MLTENEIVCIFESDFPIQQLSEHYNLKTDLIVAIQVGLYGSKFTEDLIPGRIKRFNARPKKNIKLEPEEVQFIIGSTRTYKELSELFNVSKDVIYNIKHGYTWKHIDRSNLRMSKKQAAYGEQSSGCKLTEAEVTKILSLLDKKGTRSIAKEFNVSVWTILAIRKGRNWAHLPRTVEYKKRIFDTGTSHRNGKVTESMLKEIMINTEPLKVLAKKFNLSPSTICRARQKYVQRNKACYNSPKSVSHS